MQLVIKDAELTDKHLKLIEYVGSEELGGRYPFRACFPPVARQAIQRLLTKRVRLQSCTGRCRRTPEVSAYLRYEQPWLYCTRLHRLASPRNRVGGSRLVRLPTSHTIVRTDPYTAVQLLKHFESAGAFWSN